MYILEKLILLTIFRKCYSYNYNNFHKSNTMKINNFDEKNSGLDTRYKKEEIFDEYYFKLLYKNQILLDKLKDNKINNIEKLNLINEAEKNGLLNNTNMSINILSGGLLDDYEFKF